MTYVDGFVLAVPADKREAYRESAQNMVPVFKDQGALHVVECWGDDVPEGEVTSFPLAVKCQPGEVVVFSWVVWPSKTVRDEAMPKAMQDPRLPPMSELPWDGKRVIFGGFEMIVDG